MNYKYQVGDEDIILNSEEHFKVVNAQQEGVGRVLFLREGTLGINPAHIKSITETNELTLAQEKEKQERMKFTLDAPRYDVSKFLAKMKKELSEKLGWKK